MTTRIFLDAAEKPANIPAWLTQEYLEKCAADTELQKSWEPKIGDWYFCGDLYQITQITDLLKYYSEGEVPSLPTDHGKNLNGHWTCDIYLPEPTSVTAPAR